MDVDVFLAQLQVTVRGAGTLAFVPALAADGFTDRVMASIALERVPSRRAVGFLPSWIGSVLGPVAAVRDAWHVSMSPGRPLAVRARAFSLVLIASFALGATATAALGAGRWLASGQHDRPVAAPTAPAATDEATGQSASPPPTPSQESPTTARSSPAPGVDAGAPRSTSAPAVAPRPVRTARPAAPDQHGSAGSGDDGDRGGSSGDSTDGSAQDGGGSGSGDPGPGDSGSGDSGSSGG